MEDVRMPPKWLQLRMAGCTFSCRQIRESAPEPIASVQPAEKRKVKKPKTSRTKYRDIAGYYSELLSDGCPFPGQWMQARLTSPKSPEIEYALEQINSLDISSLVGFPGYFGWGKHWQWKWKISRRSL